MIVEDEDGTSYSIRGGEVEVSRCPEDLLRAERAEAMISDAHRAMGGSDEVSEHPFDRVTDGADGMIQYDPEDEDSFRDTSRDDVALGVGLGLQAAREGKRVFVATCTDLDGRDFHFFFVAADEDEVVERVRSLLKGG